MFEDQKLLDICLIAKTIFEKKYHQYGNTFKFLYNETIIDLLTAKANSVHYQLTQNINNTEEIITLINYCIIFKIKDTNNPLQLHKQTLDEIINLINQKQKLYSSTYKQFNKLSLIQIIQMKLFRAKYMAKSNNSKILDEINDICAYSIFLASKLQ